MRFFRGRADRAGGFRHGPSPTIISGLYVPLERGPKSVRRSVCSAGSADPNRYDPDGIQSR